MRLEPNFSTVPTHSKSMWIFSFWENISHKCVNIDNFVNCIRFIYRHFDKVLWAQWEYFFFTLANVYINVCRKKLKLNVLLSFGLSFCSGCHDIVLKHILGVRHNLLDLFFSYFYHLFELIFGFEKKTKKKNSWIYVTFFSFLFHLFTLKVYYHSGWKAIAYELFCLSFWDIYPYSQIDYFTHKISQKSFYS